MIANNSGKISLDPYNAVAAKSIDQLKILTPAVRLSQVVCFIWILSFINGIFSVIITESQN